MKTPSFDPIFRIVPQSQIDRPGRLAFVFALTSTLTSCLAAALQGHLIGGGPEIQPLWRNASTLIDFLLLDPLVILYVLRSYNSTKRLGLINDQLAGLSKKAALLLSLLTLGVMGYYVSSYFDGKLFDALQVGPGVGGITCTGWIVYCWTAIFVYFVFAGFFVQSLLFLKIRNLSTLPTSYQPLHSDGCGGLRKLAQPAWDFLNVMFWLSVIFLLFYVQDRILNRFEESVRFYLGLFCYLIGPPVFLTPVMKIHRMMLKAREHLVTKLSERCSCLIAQLENDSPDIKQLAADLDSLIKARERMLSFPTWPLPVSQMAKSIAYLVPAFVQYVPKILSIIGTLRSLKVAP